MKKSGLAPNCPAVFQGTMRPVPSIMIIDDHPGFVSAVRKVLSAEGFLVVGEAFDGLSGVELAERIHPDVILLDIQLPDIDGFEVARRLEELEDPPVVVLTSSRDAADYGSQVQKAPARGFIGKAELSGARLDELLSAPR